MDLLGAPVTYYLPDLKPENPNYFTYCAGSPQCGGFFGPPGGTSLMIHPVHKARILSKKTLEKIFFGLQKAVKSIQTVGYNGRRTVLYFIIWR